MVYIPIVSSEKINEDARHNVHVAGDKYFKDASVIQNASSGLALQGVLVSRKLNDLISKRNVVLRPPEDVQLMGPSIDQQSKSWYFTSERHEERVTAIVDTLGYSVAKLAKVGDRGVSLELSGSVYEEETVGASILQDDNFNSTVKYSFLPVKSFTFSDQLCLSSDALAHLKEMDKNYSSIQEMMIKAQCTDFLRKFGSHVYTGPLHFGGKYRLRSSSSGFKESERQDVHKLQGEVISMQERSGSTSAPMMISEMEGKFQHKYTDALVSQTTLEVDLIGGRLVDRDYSEWVRGLEASNSMWRLIDRGTERVPVWDVFKRKHANDFQNSSALVDIMKRAWETVNRQSSIADENDDVVDLRKHVTEIHVPITDHGEGEEQTEAIHSESAPMVSAAEKRNVTERYKYVPTTVPREEQTGARDGEGAKKTNFTEKYVPTDVPQYLIKEKEQTGARDGEDAAKTKVPTIIFQDDKKREEAKALIGNLGLTEYYPQKLTVLHSLQIREDTLDIETSTAEETRDKSIARADPHLYPFRILQKIMAFDPRCRLPLTSHSTNDGKSGSGSESDIEIEEEMETIVHPMDGLLALLHCSDNFLRQDLMCRLATCQLAVPLLLPDPITHEPTFLLWALRTVVKEFRVADGTASYSGPIVGYPAPIVSFLRLGHHSKSKSHLLNTIINTTEYATHFFHWNCEGGTAKHILVNGLVEVSWYLPSNTDNVFPDAICFANLHGDAREHTKQVKFLSEVSIMHFILLNEDGFDDNAVEILKCLSRAPGGVVILQTEQSAKNISLQEKVEKLFPENKKSNLIKLFNKNESEIKSRIQKRIKSKFVKSDLTLDDISGIDIQYKTIAKKCGIAVDDDDSDCVRGRKLADEFKIIVHQFKKWHPHENPKQLLVLQSSELWHKWAAMDKEQYRQTQICVHVQPTPTFEYGEPKRKKMDLIRKQQLTSVRNLGPLMTSFLTTLLSNQGDIVRYYLQWLKLILDDLSGQLLLPLHNQYRIKIKELNDIQMQKKRNESAEIICQGEIKALSMELINASFGLKHLLREISQMYEAVFSQEGVPQNLKSKICRLPEIAARLLIDGFPIELIDGDAAHVPQKWVSAILEKVSEIIRDKTSDASNSQIFVLSVLGLQSTGKSTMMNTLFGVQFAVSAGRCTRGAFMQLLPVHSSLQKKCGFQYVLIIDAEGLRAPELDAQQMQKHDDELATFVIGMANLTIINIKGEITGDMDDILQTFIHAFLRMKEVKLRPSCHFVHHNVAAITADEKAMMGRFKIKDKLDRMTQKAAEEEGLQTECRYFSKVTTFDYEKDISFFQNLWTGSPPMAPVSPGYSLEAQVLKYRLIHFMQNFKKNHRSSFVHLKQHLKQLWKAVLHNNFKNLRKSFEIAAYNTHEEQYGEWSWSFKQKMRDWERNAQNELKGCAKEKLTFVYKVIKDSLDKYVEGVYEELQEKMNKYFEESTEIIIKWKFDTDFRIKALKKQLQKKGSDLCFQLYYYEKTFDIIHQKKEGLRRDILDRVQQLASHFEKGTISDKDLEEKFDENWTEWMTELTLSFVPIVPPDIKSDVEKTMVDCLKEKYSKLLKKKISDPVTGNSLEQWGSTLELKVEYKHFTFSTSLFTFTGVATHAYKTAKGLIGLEETHPAKVMTFVKDCADSIFDEVKHFLEAKQKSGSAYNPDLTLEMLKFLFDKIYAVKSEWFQLTHEFRVDMALICCGYAQKVFQRMSDKFLREHDPLQYMEKVMRFPCMKLFKDKYRQIAKEKISAEVVCLQLTQSVKYQVISQLIPAIAEDMRGHYPWFKTKKGFKMKVLLDIGDALEQQRKLNRQKCAFDDCALYLTDAKENLKHWIKRYTNTHCNEGHPSRLTQITERELPEIINFIEFAARKVTKSFVPIPKEFHIQDWLKEFHSEIKGKVEIDVKELCELGGIEDLANIQFFTDEFVKGLRTLQTTLITEFKHHRGDGWELDWKKKLYDILYEEVAGCTEQCPFCQEQCELTINYHSQSVKHATQHRPTCLGGSKWDDTREMALDTCNVSVASENSQFKNKTTGNKWHTYKTYSEIYPQWSIVPDQSMIDSESSMYWKWLVANFSPNIEELFMLKHTEIPKEWKKLKWEEVQEWVKEKYNM